VTVGAAVVGAAALLPFAILAAIGVAAWRGWVRRQRSRALDATTPG
jgi:predicted membrane-bound mannosyltransferase